MKYKQYSINIRDRHGEVQISIYCPKNILIDTFSYNHSLDNNKSAIDDVKQKIDNLISGKPMYGSLQFGEKFYITPSHRYIKTHKGACDLSNGLFNDGIDNYTVIYHAIA